MNPTFLDFTRYDIAEFAVADIAQFTGDAQSDVIIFVHKQAYQDNEKELLHNIIAALKIQSEPYICALQSGSRLRTAQIENFTNYQYLLLFGIGLQDLSIHAQIPYYSPHLLGHQKVLLSEGLDVLESEKEKKIMLWSSMKEMFDIK